MSEPACEASIFGVRRHDTALEIWIPVDARGERIVFKILCHTARGDVATRSSGGWRKSAVFGKAFRLTRQLDDLGHPDFTLDVK